jgi:WD40 repeat protein
MWEAEASLTMDPIKHTDCVDSVRFSPDGMLLATGGNENDMAIKIWNPIAGTHIHTLCGHSSSISSLAFSDDKSMLASGDDDGTVHVWDVSSGRLLLTLSHDATYGNIRQLQFTEDNLNLILRTYKTTYTWDITLTTSGEELEEATGVQLLSKKSEGNRSDSNDLEDVSQGYFFKVKSYHKIFMGKSGQKNASIVGAVPDEYSINKFAFHTNCNHLALGCVDGSVLIVDISRLKLRLEPC